VIFRRTRNPNDNSPTSHQGLWGFFSPLVWAGILAAALGMGIVLGGCSGSPSSGNIYTAEAIAHEDSLGLEEFLALDATRRQARRKEAAFLVEESRNAPESTERIRALVLAAGLVPDDPDYWLELAKVWRWIGDNLRTKTCLDNAAAAVRHLGSGDSDLKDRSEGYRKDAALRTGVLRAWLHYDRAEYHDGLSWAKAAVKLEPGNSTAIQILGILEGSMGHRSQALEVAEAIQRTRGYHTDVSWIRSVVERSVGRYREAFNYFLNLRPIEDHAAECFRDMGLAAERVQEWSYARRWFRDSRAHLPFEDTSSLVEISFERLDTRYDSSQMPVWLAFGRYYVTGSRSAYTAYAFQQFDQAVTAEARDQWAGLVVNSAGICLRMKEDQPWALRARGIVFSRTGKEDRGLEDLERAAAALDDLGLQDARVEAEIGHLQLVKQQQRRAVVTLGQAVQLDDQYAAAWCDLGLALIMTGDQKGAEKALSKSIQLNPDSVTAWYNRGLLNMHAGQLDQAQYDLGRAAELAPDNQDVARLLQQVVRQQNQSQSE